MPDTTEPVYLPLGWVGTLTFMYIPLSALYLIISHAFGNVLVIAITVIGAIAQAVLTMKILYRGWMAIQDDYVRTTPGKAVGFLFIPVFNLYWVFVAIGAYAKGFNAFISRHQIPAKRLPEKLFITQCILMILGIVMAGIPVAGFIYSNVVAIISLVTLWHITNAVNEVYSYATKSQVPEQKNEAIEYIILGLCLCVIALRTTFTEGPTMQSTGVASSVTDSLYSLSVSTVLIFSFVLWVVWSVCRGRFSYRPAGMEIGLGVLCNAAVTACLAAADKRLALTDVTVFLAPPLMALLLVQILDSPSKVKLVLVVIAALGVVSAYQCAEQLIFSNRLTIEQYKQDPQSLLEPLGIEPGSLQQFMFEHRLYSGGVRGFFTTRNSAGSFALMAFFAAVVLFLDKFKKRRSDPSARVYLLGNGLAAAVILLSLALTRSKGAIAGLLLAAAAFAVVRLFGGRLRPYRRIILAACLLLGVAGGWAIVSYGLSHGRLPGGNSMLVRWQYWHAAAQMYADHPLAGVGPGNFAHFYTRYKPAAALESVSDPHNFPLSLLTQYGPLGLVGFLVMVLLPLWKATSPESGGSALKNGQNQPAFGTIATAFVIILSAALLILRPILMRTGLNETFEVVLYVIVTMYVAPVAVFVIGFVLLAGPLGKTPDITPQIWDRRVVAGLCCAVLGVALHNLTDFAIFEPGVLTTFWAIIACLIAIDSHTSRRAPLNLKASPIAKVIVVTAALAMSYAYLSYILIPAATTSSTINRANEAISAGQFDSAHALLDKAAKADPLSAAALSMNGRLYLHQFELTHSNSLQLLTRAAQCLQAAIARNNAAFKDFERLTDAYYALGEIASPPEQSGWFNKAFEAASLSIERYPGCERLHFKLAQIAEYLGKTETAVEQYGKAIEIEDQYRAQFKLLYPEWQYTVSRLGEEKYQLAVERVRKLSEKSDR